VLEPQATLFFVLLMVAFAALVILVALSKQIVFRVLAACLAFIPAMVFGVAAVNKYYDYYQTWHSLFADLSSQGATGVQKETAAGLGSLSGATGGITPSQRQLYEEVGDTVSTTITGPKSHISRQVLIYLPPAYFEPKYAHFKFPAIELLHGSPGNPGAWIEVMNVIPTYLALLDSGQATPAVLVMPDTDGGYQYGLQCLNDPGGLQDMTYVGEEVPDAIYHLLRVQPPGNAWGIAGYSEGGFCAANIGLQEPYRYGFVGSLSGYFAPIPSQVPLHNKPGGRPIQVNDFAHNHALLLRNTPDWYILHISPNVATPQFFLAAGSENAGDVESATYFKALLSIRQTDVPLDIVQGGGHQARVWRAALTPMFKWMTPQLTQNAIMNSRPQKTAHQTKSTTVKPAGAKPKKHAAPKATVTPTPPAKRHTT
jgi:enterochelin esterase-like enzyme